MSRHPESNLVRALATAGSALAVTGCVATQLEFDRMQNTAYPTEQTLDGQDWTLASIYTNGGKLLLVDEDDTNIPALTSNGSQQNCISNAELDSLATTWRDNQIGPATFPCGFNRRYTCTRYQLYGIVVDHFGRSGGNGACSTGLLGRMWQTPDRSAFAIFYSNNTIQTDGQKYLRTTAHEIGHAFNLHHGDGDGSATLMNQTSVVGDSFSYEFSSDSRTHLDDHPSDCVFPGTGSFTSVTDAHDGWHSGVSGGCN